MKFRPIVTDEDRLEALQEIERLWGADIGTPEGDKLEALAILVEAYDLKRWPIEPLDPVDSILGHMDLSGRTQADLAKLLGSRSRRRKFLTENAPSRSR